MSISKDEAKAWAAWFEHGLCKAHCDDGRSRTYLCMGVVKLDDVPNWDTEQMAREHP